MSGARHDMDRTGRCILGVPSGAVTHYSCNTLNSKNVAALHGFDRTGP